MAAELEDRAGRLGFQRLVADHRPFSGHPQVVNKPTMAERCPRGRQSLRNGHSGERKTFHASGGLTFRADTCYRPSLSLTPVRLKSEGPVHEAGFKLRLSYIPWCKPILPGFQLIKE